MISLVMSLYNGEKYVIEQLDSIKDQDRKIDEVILLDDCSTDNTYDIVNDYIKKNELSHWVLIKNENNLGWRKSFHRALSTAKGDIIFLCDQDDIWETNKVSIMSEIMENNHHIGLLSCGYTVFYDDNVEKTSMRLTNNMTNTGCIKKINLDEKFMYIKRPGCTYAVRRTFYEQLESVWNDELAHDAILWRYAILQDKAYLLEQNLILWRRHNGASSLESSLIAKENYRQNRMRYGIEQSTKRIEFLSAALRWIQLNGNTPSGDVEILLKKNIEFEKEHIKVFEEESLFQLIKVCIKYNKFYLSHRTQLGEFKLLLTK